MDLQSQVQDLLDLSSHVTLLLQKQSDTLIRKKALTKGDCEEDLNDLSYDIALASRSLQVLEVRREIRAVIGELTEIKEKIENYGDNLSSNWFDYVQDTMESLHLLLKKGIEVASVENPTFEQKSNSHKYYKELPSSENKVYRNNIHCEIPQTLQPPHSDNSKDRSISMFVHNDHDLEDSSSETIHDDCTENNSLRGHTMDSENAPATKLFVGNLGLKKSPSKSSTTTFFSSDQICTNTASTVRVPFWSTEATKDNNLSVTKKHLTQLIIHENDELNDEFVDAVESQESNFGDIQIKELSSFTQKYNNAKRASSIYSLPTTLNTSFEDDSSHMSDYNDDNFSDTSFAPSEIVSSPSPHPFQISLNRCNSSSNLAENVTVSNPIRIGTGISSYTVYTCTISCPDELVVRKRYSDFVKLRAQLIKAQPKYRKLIPNLPPKKIVGKFVPEFIEKRRKDMEYFLTYVLLHPVLGATPVVKWWLID
ncbi:hypothetical protein RclHR1_04580010 [Rhizophagus clarus]|uniref:Endosomal/vacuolar adapter protein YPT35 n=1 Tax=Rhizophagus clarus TaxID=94130 RepID=A0A2Z6S0N6_9GLOM|nr:hypothetical protein RclHR1_04580010 [Rhizophagus clarus]GES77764.1 PX domain protein [Rhizophagus clarus]